MKKKLLVLTLSLGLLTLGATSAFADAETNTNYGRDSANGHSLYESGKTVEEILALKIEKIDQLVKDGKITAAKANEYKTTMAERQATCDGLGSNRDNHERLGIRFGDGLKDGTGNQGERNGLHRGGFRNK